MMQEEWEGGGVSGRNDEKNSVKRKYDFGIRFAPHHTQNPLPRSFDGSPSTFVATPPNRAGIPISARQS